MAPEGRQLRKRQILLPQDDSVAQQTEHSHSILDCRVGQQETSVSVGKGHCRRRYLFPLLLLKMHFWHTGDTGMPGVNLYLNYLCLLSCFAKHGDERHFIYNCEVPYSRNVITCYQCVGHVCDIGKMLLQQCFAHIVSVGKPHHTTAWDAEEHFAIQLLFTTTTS